LIVFLVSILFLSSFFSLVFTAYTSLQNGVQSIAKEKGKGGRNCMGKDMKYLFTCILSSTELPYKRVIGP